MKNILLLLVSLFLIFLFAPIGALTFIVLLIIKDSRERYTKVPDYTFNVALGIDLLGNVVCSELFNVCLIKHNAYQFGRVGETISSVLGKGERDNNLTGAGKSLAFLLNRLDKDHCKNSIQEFKEK